MAEKGNRMEGKVALVTGAASGIGLAVTQTFLSQGAKVFGVDFSKENSNRTLLLLEKEGFEKSTYDFQLGDVADEEVVQSLVSQCAQSFGRLDIAVLNAGTGVIKPISQLTMEDIPRMSKFAVRALAVIAAQEYVKDKIRVNCVSPGFVATPLSATFNNLEATLKATPAERWNR
ncbi:hypothetical protein E8E13_011088 [Curvularia kusanoi]|uniref:Uncharacterized protein n=1 Tax=Curvularia kusanoi TaxID=90978 RepID=A0A9P4TJI8_CURKU|nr:hypothetical protein E8E13_011088 [Curvularia kusanoi]